MGRSRSWQACCCVVARSDMKISWLMHAGGSCLVTFRTYLDRVLRSHLQCPSRIGSRSALLRHVRSNPSPQVFDSLITSRSDEGDGFQVVGNQISYNRGRG